MAASPTELDRRIYRALGSVQKSLKNLTKPTVDTAILQVQPSNQGA
jgi:hypothetical protein